MATTEARKLITAEEFLEMDLGSGIHELVRGEVIELPRPMPEHGLGCGNSAGLLYNYGRESGYGYMLSNDSAVQTERGPDTVRGPDICFYSHARWPRSRVGKKIPPVPPDLAIEVYSPSNRAGEMRAKVHEYLNASVLVVWVIRPDRQEVFVYRPDDLQPTRFGPEDVLEILPELPGFRCRVADFFE